MTAPRHPWKLSIGGKVVALAKTRTQLQGREASFWMRHRRGRRITVYHQLSGETWEWKGTTWIRTQAANQGAA